MNRILSALRAPYGRLQSFDSPEACPRAMATRATFLCCGLASGLGLRAQGRWPDYAACEPARSAAEPPCAALRFTEEPLFLKTFSRRSSFKFFSRFTRAKYDAGLSPRKLKAQGSSSTGESANAASLPDGGVRAPEPDVHFNVEAPPGPEICTADELHFTPVSGGWRLALWRYMPPPSAPKRNHPVLLLSGVATNAIAWDLEPEVSMARHLAEAGFETWTLEVRGAGLSYIEEEPALPGGESASAMEVEGALQSKMTGGDGGGVATHDGAAAAVHSAQKTVKALDHDLGGSNGAPGPPGPEQQQKGQGGANGEEARPGRQPLPLSPGLSSTVNQLREQLTSLVDEEQRAALHSLVAELRESLGHLMEGAGRRSSPLSERVADVAGRLGSLLDEGQRTAVASRMEEAKASLARLVEEGQKAGLPERVRGLADRMARALDGEPRTALARRAAEVRESLRRVLSEGQQYALRRRIAELVQSLNGIVEGGQRLAVAERIAELQRRLATMLEEGQQLVAAPPGGALGGVGTRLSSIMDETQRTLALLGKYTWDFDTYLFEDVPAAIAYVKKVCAPADDKILAVGHSMGGILLYATLAVRGPDSELAAAVAVASALDYACSNSSLKLVLPLADPAKLLNVPVVPLGVMAKSALPFIDRPPYTLAYIGYQVSARKMMEPHHFRKLWLTNFCTIPVKLLLQLASVFRPGGLRNRDGTVEYRKGLEDCATPILALAGNADLICPAIAVTETLKCMPEKVVTYKLLGDGRERNYGHYDLLAGRHAKEDVYPLITDFLVKNDAWTDKDKPAAES